MVCHSLPPLSFLIWLARAQHAHALQQHHAALQVTLCSTACSDMNSTYTLVLTAGVWLLARCADLAAFSYDVTQFWYAIKVLFYIGLGSRLAACLAMLVLHRFKSV